jgi:hypothetical protein
MRVFFQKSVQHFENNSGKKKSSFEIIKGKNGEVEQIKGFSTNDDKIFHIKQQKIKKNDATGQPKVSYKIFKIKSSNLVSLMDSSKSKDDKSISKAIKPKKSSSKEVKSKKSSTKEVKPKKSSTKEVKPKKSSTKKKSTKKSISKTTDEK